jgi:staphyloferrin B biosynthesis citrate synthase
MTTACEFRRRLLGSELTLGTFIKTPTTHAIEILGGLGFDFVVIDEEHAPFDRMTVDTMLLAARASNIAALVRVADLNPSMILAALDDGAAGVLVPHVDSVAKARELVAACRYQGGKRGYSNSPRAGEYGHLGIWDHVRAADASVSVIAMIEDPEAIDEIDSIVSVEGLDGVFVGRGDLTLAMGASTPNDPIVEAAAKRVITAARLANKPAIMMVADASEVRIWHAAGATGFIIASDQGFMRQAAARSRNEFAQLQS